MENVSKIITSYIGSFDSVFGDFVAMPPERPSNIIHTPVSSRFDLLIAHERSRGQSSKNFFLLKLRLMGLFVGLFMRQRSLSSQS